MEKALIYMGLAATVTLTACVETSSNSGGLSDNAIAPVGMREACIAQATRLTGVPESGIVAANPIEAGPDRRAFIGLTVNGASYGCRIEDDGSYTVFSQFAN